MKSREEIQREEQKAIKDRKLELEARIEALLRENDNFLTSTRGHIYYPHTDLHSIKKAPTDYRLLEEIFNEKGYELKNYIWDAETRGGLWRANGYILELSVKVRQS